MPGFKGWERERSDPWDLIEDWRKQREHGFPMSEALVLVSPASGSLWEICLHFPWTLQHIFNKQRKFDPENIHEKKLIFYWNTTGLKTSVVMGKNSQRIQV